MKKSAGKKKWNAIMLIDDNDLDNLINRRLIENYDICDIVYVHTSARSAIEFLRNIERLKTAPKVIPNLIVLDVDMPLMDGFQFLEEFKKLSKLVQDTSVVMILTSSKNMTDFDQSKKYKCVHRFTRKPLTYKDLMALFKPPSHN